MPKDVWIYRRRKKKRKSKSVDSEHDAEVIERSRMLDPNVPEISIGTLSDLTFNLPVKTEEEIYPDTRFEQSTTLFPAKDVEEECLPEIPSQTLKRFATEELGSRMIKKERVSEPPKAATNSDCIIVEKPKARIKVEVIDLTDDSEPIDAKLCSPVKTSCIENRLPDKLSTPLQGMSNAHVKVESSESCRFNSRAVFEENINPSVDNHFRIHIKTEESTPSESIDYNEADIENSMDNHIQIKAEKGSSVENHTEVQMGKSRIVSGEKTNLTTQNIRSELNKENEDNRLINISIKEEQNENCAVSDSSETLLNLSSNVKITVLHSVDPSNYEQTEDFSIVSSEMASRNDLNQMEISITDGGIFGNEAQLQVPRIFPLLKYLSCNTKVDALEISHALSLLNNLIISKEVNEIDLEVIPVSMDLREKSESWLGEKRKELPDQQINEEESLKEFKVVHEIYLSNFTPNITSLGINSDSFQRSSVNEMRLKSPLNSVFLGNKMPRSNSPQMLFESLSNIRESIETLNGAVENKKVLPDLKENGKELFKDQILQNNTLSKFSELENLERNVIYLDSDSDLSQSKHSVNDRKEENKINSDGLGDKMEQKNRPNMFFELHSKMNELSRESDSESRTTYFNSPMVIESSLEDKSPSIIYLSSSENNGQGENSSNLEMEEQKNEFVNYDVLHQILGNAKLTERSVSNLDSSLNPSVPVAKSSIITDEILFYNLGQTKLSKDKPVEKVNFTTDVSERKSGQTKRKSRNFSKNISLPLENAVKRSEGAFVNPPMSTFENPSKKLKVSGDAAISEIGSVKYLNYQEHKKDTREMSNSPNTSTVVSNLGQNMFTPLNNSQNFSLSACSQTSSQDAEYHPLVNTSSPKDPRLAHNYSPVSQSNVNSQKTISLNINQTCPSQSIPEAAKFQVSPLVNQITSDPTIYASPNFPRPVLSHAEVFHPTINALQIQQMRPLFPQVNNFQPSYFDQQTSVTYNHVCPAPESIQFSTAQHYPPQSVQCVGDQSPFLALQYFPGCTSVPSSQYHLVPSSISSHNTLNYDNCSVEGINYGFGSNPPLPFGNPPPLPPLPLTPPPTVEEPHSTACTVSPSSLLHNNKKYRTKNLPLSKNFSSKSYAPIPSLLPKHLKEDIGKNIIPTNGVYLIIIERNIDWIHGIDKEIGVPRMSENGGDFQPVRDIYGNHLQYYNTYFPLLLLDCFSRISTALKTAKHKEKDRNLCKVIHCENKQSYVSLTCESFIRHSDVENLPKDGHIILVKFAAIPEGTVRMLGYVYSSATRAYSHKHDHGNEILKFAKVNKRTDLIKIRINFYIVFDVSDINLDVPIHVSKLTSIKRALVLNEALVELQRSPLCDTILGLKNNNIKGFSLPRRQDINAMTTVVQEVVQSLNLSSSQLTVIKSAPFTDSYLAIVQIVEEIQKSKISGKILVCVRSEMLSQMGLNLIETPNNVIIINREKESVTERLHSRVLDVKISFISKAQNLSDDAAKRKVLHEADVLLAVTGTCFYQDVRSLARDLTHCIIHDAHSFTEPESLLPMLYSIRHLLLFGDPDDSCTVNSKCGASLGYNKSLFHRAYSLC